MQSTDPIPQEGRLRLFIPVRRTLTLWLWAALVGALAAGATTGFRWLMREVEWVATGHAGGLVEAARSLAPWHRAVVCAVGGLLAGLSLALGKRWAARGEQGSEHLDYIDAARHDRVDLNDRMTIARSVSALLSVGTGASIGREGPMVQLSAWLAATLARWLPLAARERTALLVAGIAAGIGSAYHAPVAGVVFVLELALGFIVPHAIAPVLIAAATSLVADLLAGRAATAVRDGLGAAAADQSGAWPSSQDSCSARSVWHCCCCSRRRAPPSPMCAR